MGTQSHTNITHLYLFLVSSSLCHNNLPDLRRKNAPFIHCITYGNSTEPEMGPVIYQFSNANLSVHRGCGGLYFVMDWEAVALCNGPYLSPVLFPGNPRRTSQKGLINNDQAWKCRTGMRAHPSALKNQPERTNQEGPGQEGLPRNEPTPSPLKNQPEWTNQEGPGQEGLPRNEPTPSPLKN